MAEQKEKLSPESFRHKVGVAERFLHASREEAEALVSAHPNADLGQANAFLNRLRDGCSGWAFCNSEKPCGGAKCKNAK